VPLAFNGGKGKKKGKMRKMGDPETVELLVWAMPGELNCSSLTIKLGYPGHCKNSGPKNRKKNVARKPEERGTHKKEELTDLK